MQNPVWIHLYNPRLTMKRLDRRDYIAQLPNGVGEKKVGGAE